MKDTKIGWTNDTWNPWEGCTKISPGCAHCYMYTDLGRKKKLPSVVRRCTTTFNDPLKQMAHRMIFTCSYSDFFHEAADPWRSEAWDIIRRTPQHTYLILTKRPERMAAHLPWTDRPWPHVWLGVSVENQRYADERVPILLATTAAHRFLSIEPLLGPIDLRQYLSGIDWVIVGGESGEDFRPMEIAWLEDIVAQCDAAQVPIFVKQDVGPQSGMRGRLSDAVWAHKVRTDDIDLNTSDLDVLFAKPVAVEIVEEPPTAVSVMVKKVES
jgi:protein gp37